MNNQGYKDVEIIPPEFTEKMIMFFNYINQIEDKDKARRILLECVERNEENEGKPINNPFSDLKKAETKDDEIRIYIRERLQCYSVIYDIANEMEYKMIAKGQERGKVVKKDKITDNPLRIRDEIDSRTIYSDYKKWCSKNKIDPSKLKYFENLLVDIFEKKNCKISEIEGKRSLTFFDIKLKNTEL